MEHQTYRDGGHLLDLNGGVRGWLDAVERRLTERLEREPPHVHRVGDGERVFDERREHVAQRLACELRLRRFPYSRVRRES